MSRMNVRLGAAAAVAALATPAILVPESLAGQSPECVPASRRTRLLESRSGLRIRMPVEAQGPADEIFRRRG